MDEAPSVLLLDGDYPSSLTMAKELTEDLGATIVGVGTTRYSRLLRSKYCDVGVTAPPAGDDRYADSLRSAIHTHRPQFVLPIGYQSTAELERLRSDLPAFTSVSLPRSESFDAGSDKETTMAYATELGMDVPRAYTAIVADIDASGRSPGALERLDFPVFLKARREAGGGGSTTARVDDPSRFWETYDRMRAAAPESKVLVQEVVMGSNSTYGVGLLFADDDAVLQFCHEELRSVPRRGGSGTHLRIHRDRTLERRAIELLESIGWHGIALVEFKRRADGSFVLMEINPKFWASYALASRYGYRFASTMVALALDLDVEVPIGAPKPAGEMVFPLRELYYVAQNPVREPVRECLGTVLASGVNWNVDRDDLGAWLTPPVGVIEQVPLLTKPRDEA